jgi:ABC-type sugar transport system substrate-binding protein
MKKATFFMGIFLCSVFIFSGCQRKQQSAAEASDSADLSNKEVTLILKNLTNPFFISVKEGAEAAAAEYGYKITVLAPLKADSNEEQMQMVEQSIARQTDLLIVIPADTMGIIPVIEKVYAAKIPVVVVNTKIGSDKVMWETFVAIENYDGGYLATKYLCEALNGQGEIMLIEGVVGAQTSIDRIAGAKDAIAEFPNIKLIAQQSGEYNRAKSMDVVQNLLQAHPNVNAIFCANDEMALGAIEAVESSGRKPGSILISGADANNDARQAVKEGKLTLTVDGQPYMQGYTGAEAAGKILLGEKVEDRIIVPISVVTKDTLKND